MERWREGERGSGRGEEEVVIKRKCSDTYICYKGGGGGREMTNHLINGQRRR